MYQRFDQFAAVQFVVIVRIVHFKVMELKFLFRHFARVHRDLHVFHDVSGNKHFIIRRGTLKKINNLRTFYKITEKC